MRFDVTQVLDAIERHLTTESALAQAVVDLGHVAWYDALDGGRPVSLLRAGLLVDALSRHIGDDAVMVYAVASRDLLTDADLTSKERMVLGRWAGDGMIEVVPVMADRVPGGGRHHRVARDHDGRFPGARAALRLAAWAARTGAAAGAGRGRSPDSGRAPGAGANPEGRGAALLGRIWRCPRRDCPTFGERRVTTQAVPRMKAAVPVCPRHDEPLVNAGARPPSVTMVLIVDGVVRDRFVVRAGRPVVVGRSPDEPDGLMIGSYLGGDAAQMISRNHVRLDLRDEGLFVADLSTNGTVVRARSAPYSSPDEVHLSGGAPYLLKPWDTVELHTGVVAGSGRPDADHVRRWVRLGHG